MEKTIAKIALPFLKDHAQVANSYLVQVLGGT